MNILLVCNKSPWPPLEGGPIAMNAMVEGLIQSGHKVKVLAINSQKYHVDINSIPDEYRIKTEIELVYIDLSIKSMSALECFVKNESYHVKRFISKDFESALKKILQNNHYDIIQLESLYIAPYIPLIRKFSKSPIILRAHNIEHLIWKRLVKDEKNLIKRLYLNHLAKTLQEFELRILKTVDGILAITPKDESFFRQHAPETPLISAPFGISFNYRVGNDAMDDLERNLKTVFHLGSMNWLPNEQGIKWFLNKVWPSVNKLQPDIEFHLAGRSMPKWLLQTTIKGVTQDGEVPDSMLYMQRYRIMIVPLFSGSGLRIKIIEGMFSGCAIITTSVGAEGIDYIDGKHLIIANNPQEFIDAIIRLTNYPEMAKHLGDNAKKLVLKKNNIHNIIEEVVLFYNKVINQI